VTGIASLEGHLIVVPPAEWLQYVLDAQGEDGKDTDALTRRAAIRAVLAAGQKPRDWDLAGAHEMPDGRVIIARLLEF
jgi:hypothetical protein